MAKVSRPSFPHRLPLRTVIVLLFILLALLPASLIGYLFVLILPAPGSGAVIGLLLMLAFLVLAAAASGWATARWVTAPIVALNECARALANGTWEKPVPVDREDELGELAGSFNEMAVRLRSSIDVLHREVMERLRIELTLRESEEKYRTLFEESHDMVFFSTPEGTLLDVNEAGIRMLGFPGKAKLLGVHVARDLYVNPEDRMILMERLLENSEVNDFQARFRRYDGAEIQVSVTASAIRNDSGRFVALRGIVRDITEHHQLEQQLRQAQKMEAIGQLAGGIAHDFNNILTAIIGYANLLEAKLPAGDLLAEYPRNIALSAEKASQLTRGLLAFSRTQVLTMRPVSLNDLLRGMVSILRRLIREDIALQTEFCEGDTSVIADPVQIEQVVMNLSTNAADAMPGGGKITIETRVGEDHVVLSVTDTGAGMDEVTLDKIFDPFFTTKEVGKGTGLGMAMVYGIIRQHKGSIYVDSEPGKGTSIMISLPAGGAITRGEETVSETVPHSTGHETILVAEDDGALRDLVKEMLERFGYRVLLASDGAEALEIYRSESDRIDMLLVDLVMPRMNGRIFFDAARALNPRVRTLFYSGYTADLVESDSGLDPNVHILPKPFSLNELARKVRQILDAPM